MQYNPASWYWFVDDHVSGVFSSASMSFVSASDATYEAWLARGFRPTTIDTTANLNEVLADTVLSRGVVVTSTATPALDGTYAVDAASQTNIAAVSQYILVNSTFPGALSAYPWVDASGTPHAFTSVAEFQKFATAIADFVAGVIAARLGLAASFPSSAITIP